MCTGDCGLTPEERRQEEAKDRAVLPAWGQRLWDKHLPFDNQESRQLIQTLQALAQGRRAFIKLREVKDRQEAQLKIAVSVLRAIGHGCSGNTLSALDALKHMGLPQDVVCLWCGGRLFEDAVCSEPVAFCSDNCGIMWQAAHSLDKEKTDGADRAGRDVPGNSPGAGQA